MGVLSENAIIGASAAGGYDIDYSCRFDDGGGSKLTRTPSSAGNLKTWTLSFWMKQAISTTASSQFVIFDGGGVSSSETPFGIVDQCIEFNYWNSGTSSQSFKLKTNQVFRDQSAWYHIVCAYDSPQATAANRLKLYVNGSQVTSFSTANYPAQNLDATVNAAYEHYIGTGKQAQDWSGYLADFNLIDGLALTPASFAETDEDTNEWKAIKYGGAYGTNGFFLEFKSSGALGTDTSGNGHNWTSTNLAATDQMIDTPQNSTGGNFCTLNPLHWGIRNAADSVPLSEGNLKFTGSDTISTYGTWYATFQPSAGSYYFEMVPTAIGSAEKQSQYINVGGKAFKANGESSAGAYGTAWTAGDIIGVAVSTAGVWYSLNGTWQNSGDPVAETNSAGVPSYPFTILTGDGSATTNSSLSGVLNFGQDSSFAGNKTAQGNQDGNNKGDFYYTPPSGYLALCTDNLPAPSITLPGEHFNPKLYTGTGAELAITGVGFQPDFTWIKTRTLTYNHRAMDSVRAETYYEVTPNSNAAQTTADAQTLKSFDSDGFTLGTSSGVNPVSTMASWNWKAGGSPTADNDNTGGAMDANSVALNGSLQAAYTPSGSPSVYPKRMSINTTNGFSIISYTSPGTNNDESIPHGLSQAPDMVIVKNLDSAYNWDVWTPALQSGYDLRLNTTDAETASRWSTTIPSSTLVTLKNTYEVNGTDKYIAYCFHSVEGYSKIGTYASNNSADGPFIYLGFTPAFIMLKCTNATDNWNLYDIKRNGYNGTGGTYQIRADSNAAGFTSAATMVDLVSNGMKIRTNDPGTNGSSRNYLYLAFAESPFKTARAR